ncbi:MAG: dTMP kinase [Rickettsiales bacterium]|nr:dTMP kinase [Rickettsiales bacterium]
MNHKLALPLFITFEGIEGCGKSTQAKILYDYLKQQGYSVILTREPGGTAIGNDIRQILIDKKNNQIDPLTELMLNFASRIEHLQQVILPALKNNIIVISDRFYDSTLAYQGFAMGVEIEIIEKMHQLMINSIQPNITFLCDMEVEVAFQRIKSRFDNNRYEELSFDFHNKVRNGFLEIAKNNAGRIKIINANNDVSKVAEQVIKYLNF